MNSPVFAIPVDEVAVTLYVVLTPAVVGVPLMVHVPGFSVNPFGRPGDILHVAPLTLVRAIGAGLCPWTVA